ncbi:MULTISPECIES: sphingomyelin phosphodiesterase [Vibrio]|uniref:sphingomyelin phosphodiesterase n=1 Tax=Vibrio TaxID=662 RepID=UPI000316A8D9|nr:MULTISPECIES: sphingomyelin phosphodiesterase [Vibrio]OCH57094.1 phospholipase [Vibrio lentus]PMI52195.1 phospholipase [Vibrio lentus]PMI84943.1 phospholipase [Vibrio lentus]PMI86930.1 phospholipase [Vibrio lentus]
MIKKLCSTLIIWAIASQALATSLYYINRTDKPILINFSIDSSEPVSNGYQYRLTENDLVIWPYQKAKVADFNRYYGLVNGATYDYFLTISRLTNEGTWEPKPQEPVSQLRLVGHGSGSTLSYGYKDQGMMTDYNPYILHRYNQDGYHSEFGVKAIYTSGFDDVEFVVSEHTINDFDQDPNTLNVGSYNLWMLPGVSSNITSRASVLDHTLSGYDVLTLQEAFSSDREILFNALAEEYAFRTEVVGGGTSAMYDGGVVTFSRHPIIETDSIVFEHCSGTDCYADKGVVYTKVDKDGEIYHIFNTHLASFNTPAAKRLRRLQLGLMRTFMLTKDIPSNEAVIYAGDFNIDKNSDFVEYLLMLATLDVDPPEFRGYTNATFDPTINPYAAYKYSGGADVEYLDYVFVSRMHKRATSNTNTVKLHQRLSSDTWGSWHLSDHFAVNGNFEFSSHED